MKQIRMFVLLLLCISLAGCGYTPQSTLDESKYSAEAVQYENEMVKAETTMLQYILQGRVMIKEIDWNATDRYQAHLDASQISREFNEALNFGGFRTDKSIPAIYPLGGTPDDYPAFHQMTIQLNAMDSFLEYNVFFSNDFENINVQRYCTFLEGIYGVKLDTTVLEAGLAQCYNALHTVAQTHQYNCELYNKDGIYIKTVAIEDVDGTKYVAINSKYTP